MQQKISDTKQGRKKVWFAYTLLAVVVSFTSLMTSNLLRVLQTLLGRNIQSHRFYTLMGSTTLPWKALWHTMWGMIPAPATEERIIVALDDPIWPTVPMEGRFLWNPLGMLPNFPSPVVIEKR